jgi:hypothetical protein
MATLAEILALLPDNDTGLISAADVRAAVTALWGRTDGTDPIEGVLFETNPPIPVHTPGHMHWNTADGIAEIMSNTEGVVLQLGHEQWVDVRNSSGATILNGSAVQVSGATGNDPTVVLDDGLGRAIGVATHDIANNSNGKVTTFGLVRELNTAAFAAGNRIYASSTGTLTTLTTSSFVGYVLNAHVNQGSILVARTPATAPDGTTAERPTTVALGFMFFDTTLGHPVWWDGTNWVDATGATV